MIEHEAKIQTAKAVPALLGTAWYSVTLNDIVAFVTIAYVLLQIGYLIWKWCREAKEKKRG